MRVKRAFLSECADSDTVIGFCHDIEVLMGRVLGRDKAIDVVSVDSVPITVS
jgi:hypothetical protein